MLQHNATEYNIDWSDSREAIQGFYPVKPDIQDSDSAKIFLCQLKMRLGNIARRYLRKPACQPSGYAPRTAAIFATRPLHGLKRRIAAPNPGHQASGIPLSRFIIAIGVFCESVLLELVRTQDRPKRFTTSKTAPGFFHSTQHFLKFVLANINVDAKNRCQVQGSSQPADARRIELFGVEKSATEGAKIGGRPCMKCHRRLVLGFPPQEEAVRHDYVFARNHTRNCTMSLVLRAPRVG